MKKFRKITAILFAALLISVMSVSVFAATGLNDYEKQLLGDAKAAMSGFVLSSAQQAKANSMLGQVESYLSGDYELTAEGYSSSKGNLDTVVASFPTDLSKVSISGIYNKTPAISAAVDSLAQTLGVTIDISGGGTIIVRDKNGNEIGTSGGSVRPTGFAIGYLAVIAMAFVLVVAVCFVIVRKQMLVSKRP